MNSLFSFLEPVAPWVIFAPHGDDVVGRELAALSRRGGVVHRLCAEDLAEPAQIFRTFARELNFPGYFGYNWDALVDCLSDEHVLGHGANGKAVVIENADALLEAEFLSLLVVVLGEAAERANRRLDADGCPDDDTPINTLHFVFLLDSVPAHAFASRLTDPDQSVQWAYPYLLVT
jgi:RNAse (barnase) inhibitor barstar